MAGMKQKCCRACGKHHPMKALKCSCGARLIDAQIVEVDPSTPPDPVETTAEVMPPGRWTCEGCGFGQNDDHSDTCQLCEKPRHDNSPAATDESQAAQTVPTVLRFPFGDIVISERLAIGRDASFSPVAATLLGHDRISRRHAMLERFGDGDLMVRDLGSTNGTYLNGTRIEPNISVPVRIGDSLSFSLGLNCQIVKAT